MLNGIIPSTWAPTLHALLRVVTGLLLLEHGTSKLLHFPINEQLATVYAQMGTMTIVTGLIELVGGALIIAGFFTRITAFILSGFMAVAFWMVHVGMSGTLFPMINMGEAAVLFCFIFLYLAAAGAGPYSVDDSRGSLTVR
jgi:putative oxidoreductase